MAQTLDPKELVSFEELLVTKTKQIDTMYQLLIQKGYFTKAEFLDKQKEIQLDQQKQAGRPELGKDV